MISPDWWWYCDVIVNSWFPLTDFFWLCTTCIKKQIKLKVDVFVAIILNNKKGNHLIIKNLFIIGWSFLWTVNIDSVWSFLRFLNFFPLGSMLNYIMNSATYILYWGLSKEHTRQLVRKDMDVNEHKRLSNIIHF